MNITGFAIGLALIAIATVVILYFGVRQIERRPPRDPVDHGDEP